MTECERIINDGILPESFFKEESLCDFPVTKERKKIWAVNVDLLCRFDSVCRKHHLRYSVAFGSLLGIVRHHGFIPWDDDIIIRLPNCATATQRGYRFHSGMRSSIKGYSSISSPWTTIMRTISMGI